MFNIWFVLRNYVADRMTIVNTKKLPTWTELLNISMFLTKSEKRRIVLFYHPDKLVNSLQRMPTEDEIKMSNLSMAIINLLFNENRNFNEKSIMEAMNQLYILYTSYEKKLITKKVKEPKKEKEPKEPKKEKDPKIPKKRYPSGFNIYIKELTLKYEVDGITKRLNRFTLGEASKMWKNISDYDKQYYNNIAAQNKLAAQNTT